MKFFILERLLRNSRDMQKKALEKGNYIGAPIGEHGEGSFTETFDRQMEEGSGNGASLIKLI